MIAGIDISKWQTAIDWTKAHQAGVDFAIIKATEGAGYVDPMFHQHRDGAQAADVLTGAYHFLLRGSVAGIPQQVDAFLATIGTDVPVMAVDLEQHPNKAWTPVAADALAFCTLLAQRTGKMPWIYTSPGFWLSWGNPPWGYQFPLWIAQYTRSWPLQVPPWATWKIWQYTSTGRVAGINSNVDLNLMSESTFSMLQS